RCLFTSGDRLRHAAESLHQPGGLPQFLWSRTCLVVPGQPPQQGLCGGGERRPESIPPDLLHLLLPLPYPQVLAERGEPLQPLNVLFHRCQDDVVRPHGQPCGGVNHGFPEDSSEPVLGDRVLFRTVVPSELPSTFQERERRHLGGVPVLPGRRALVAHVRGETEQIPFFRAGQFHPYHFSALDQRDRGLWDAGLRDFSESTAEEPLTQEKPQAQRCAYQQHEDPPQAGVENQHPEERSRPNRAKDGLGLFLLLEEFHASSSCPGRCRHASWSSSIRRVTNLAARTRRALSAEPPCCVPMAHRSAAA